MALIYCSECGKQVSDKAMACPNCGNPIHPVSIPIQPQYSHTTQTISNTSSGSQYAEKLATKEQTSGIIWMVVAILQFIIGIAGMWFVLVVAIINAFAAYASFQKAKKVREPYPGMVEEYDKQLKAFIFSLAYNAIFGGVIGIAGNIFDLNTRNYVLTNRAIFERMADEKAQKNDEEARTSGKVPLTIQYSCSAGAATAAQYTIDGQPVKHLVSRAAPVTIYLAPGMHTISFKYNFKEFSFPFELNEGRTLSFFGNITEIKLNNIT